MMKTKKAKELFRVKFTIKNVRLSSEKYWVSAAKQGRVPVYLGTEYQVRQNVDLPRNVKTIDVVAYDRKVPESFSATVSRDNYESIALIVGGVKTCFSDDNFYWLCYWLWDLPVQELLQELRGRRLWVTIEY